MKAHFRFVKGLYEYETSNTITKPRRTSANTKSKPKLYCLKLNPTFNVLYTIGMMTEMES